MFHPLLCIQTMRRLTPQDISERVRKLHGDNITLDESTYEHCHSICRFIDKDYGEWWTAVWGVLQGRGHPKRGYARMGAKQTVSRDEMLRRLHEACGDTVTLGDDYVGVSTKCTFIDKDYGAWKQLPQRILSGTVHPKRRAEKARKTCLKRYGIGHTNHLPGVMKKLARSQRKWVKRKHWKTGEMLTCMSSYEVAFVKWCAKNCIDFEWQIRHVMPDGRAYIVDAHILDGHFADMWIEIKGWMRPEALEKWTWFHATHPNSVIWTQQILKHYNIL